MWPARAFRAASTRHAHSVAPPALSACSPQQYAVAFLQVLQKYVRRTLQLAARTPLTSQRAPKSDQTGTRGGGGGCCSTCWHHLQPRLPPGTRRQCRGDSTEISIFFGSDLRVPRKCSVGHDRICVADKVQHILSHVEDPHAVRGRWHRNIIMPTKRDSSFVFWFWQTRYHGYHGTKERFI